MSCRLFIEFHTISHHFPQAKELKKLSEGSYFMGLVYDMKLKIVLEELKTSYLSPASQTN
jgi:hypothetical protein